MPSRSHAYRYMQYVRTVLQAVQNQVPDEAVPLAKALQNHLQHARELGDKYEDRSFLQTRARSETVCPLLSIPILPL